MILPFSTQMNGKPTYFVEKIWHSFNHFQKDIKDISVEDFCKYVDRLEPKKRIDLKYLDNKFGDIHKGKCHTIREDKNDLWKAGNKIDFFINSRRKDMFRFAPVLPVVSIQKIEIKHGLDYVTIEINGVLYEALFENEKVSQCCPVILELAQNDGFDTIEDFFAYFNEDFTGKIIHWTPLRY